MPRAFREDEKQRIRHQLREVGLNHFSRVGVRAARVEDICRETGIAKGSFYAFFASKEDLFMAIADRQDLKQKSDTRAYLERRAGGASETLKGFFDFTMERVESDPVLRIVQDTGEMAHVLRKVSPPMVENNLRRDRAFLIEIAFILKDRFGLTHATAETLEALMSLMLALGLQRDVVEAAGSYANTVALLRGLFVSRLLKGADDD